MSDNEYDEQFDQEEDQQQSQQKQQEQEEDQEIEQEQEQEQDDLNQQNNQQEDKQDKEDEQQSLQNDQQSEKNDQNSQLNKSANLSQQKQQVDQELDNSIPLNQSDKYEQSFDQNELNLQSVDAVSVKIDKKPSKQPSKQAKKSGKSEQQTMVAQLLKQHKEKQKKLKQKEDDIYVQEQVAKKAPKPSQPKTKQKLVLDKETKAKLEDPKRNNQEKAAIITKDLAKKLEKDVAIKEVPKKMEIKKPSKESEPKVKTNQFDLRVGAGLKNKLEVESEEGKKKQLGQEREAFLLQKKQAKEKMMQQLIEQDEMVKEKQKQMIREQERMRDIENKALMPKTDKQEEYKQVQQAQKISKEYEQNENMKDEIKRELDLLRATKKENQQLNEELSKQEKDLKKLDKNIEEWSRKDNVINIGGKYTSLRKIKIKGGDDWLQTAAMSRQSMQDFGEPDIATKVVNKIAQNGLELKDAYSLLDEDKDGVLTMKEVMNNLSRLNLNLSEAEILQFIQLLDNNCDGVLTEQEFIQNLTQGLEVQRDFIKIMGDLKDIVNPIVLEERKIHLKYLRRYILQKFQEEQTKENSQLPRYKKLLKKLKKTEELIEILKGTSSDKGELKSICENLRKEGRLVQDQKFKIMNELNEKKEMIEENIDKLTTQLGQYSYQVLQKKETLRQQSIYTQKLQLKLLAFRQIQDKFLKEVQQKNQLELVAGQQELKLFQAKLTNQVQLKEIENLVKQNLHYVIIIQKYTKGKIFRKRLMTKLSNNKQCANILFNLYQKKQKQFQVQLLSNLEQNLKTYYANQEQIQKQKIVLKQEETQKIKQQQFLLSQMSMKKKRTEIEQQLEIIPKIIAIQKQFRLKRFQIPMTNNVYNISFGGNSDLCQICQSDLAEVICKVCQQPLYCDTCFKIGHKNYRRRNHEYYQILKEDLNLSKNGSQKGEQQVEQS